MYQQQPRQERERATSGLEVDYMADSKKYDGSQWEHSLRKLTTATEAVENPLYSDGTAITAYTIKGNTVQDGTPTPSNPVPVVGVGELETTGEHSGEYKIPILTNQGSAVNYLGSVTSARKIKKIVFTGGDDENWSEQTTNTFRISDKVNDALCPADGSLGISNMYTQVQYNNINYMTDGQFTYGKPSGTYTRIAFKNTSCADVTAWKAYLQAQYAAGTPVTVWYVLETPTTGIVNEPLMKIGTYADSISNAVSIPTTDGANSITVDTTVQPSEFTATWTGWHDSSVKEYDGTDWQ